MTMIRVFYRKNLIMAMLLSNFLRIYLFFTSIIMSIAEGGHTGKDKGKKTISEGRSGVLDGY